MSILDDLTARLPIAEARRLHEQALIQAVAAALDEMRRPEPLAPWWQEGAPPPASAAGAAPPAEGPSG